MTLIVKIAIIIFNVLVNLVITAVNLTLLLIIFGLIGFGILVWFTAMPVIAKWMVSVLAIVMGLGLLYENIIDAIQDIIHAWKEGWDI